MTKSIQFTKQDTMHAALGVIPAFLLICFGYLTPGIAFAIGLLPTSLLGIAPSRKLRLIYGILGCLFGAGVYVGSYIVNLHNIWVAALIFLVATAFVVAAVAILTIGARSSKWYITSFGTAFLILTIEMFGMTDVAAVHQIAWYRIYDNVIGALIALFFGLLVPEVLIRMKKESPSITNIKA